MILFSSDASAYLDGGTGGMIIQLLFGGFAVIVTFAKIYWNKIRSFFISKRTNRRCSISKNNDIDENSLSGSDSSNVDGDSSDK